MHFTAKIMIQHNGIVCKEAENIFLRKTVGIHLYSDLYFKSPTVKQSHKFRHAKCACQSFMCGGVSAAGAMESHLKRDFQWQAVEKVKKFDILYL